MTGTQRCVLRIAQTALCASVVSCASLGGVGAVASPPPVTAASAPSVVSRFTLDNGLIVLVEEDHTYPRVAFEARVRGGSCDDAPWVGAGLAHLMEHMVFKGTGRRPVGTIESEVRRDEGNFNAFTSYDYTGFSLSVGSAAAREGLDLLADALFHSAFDPAELAKEQEVVRSEMKMNQDDPDRRLYQRFWNAAFQVHPYRHPVIGYEELFNRLTREEVLQFYRRRYVPNNMVLAVVGDVDTAQVRRWAEALLGPAPRGTPFDWARPTEPPQLTSRRLIEPFPVQQAQMMLGFHSTRLQDQDLYPLDVLAEVLGGGESARLERRLRRELKLAHAVSAGNSTPQDPGLLIMGATVNAESIDAAAAAMLQEVRLVRREGVSSEELARAKRQILAEYFHGRQTLAARAGDLATNELLTGDADFRRKYVAGIQRVTNEEIRRVAQRYLTDEAWTLAALVPPAPHEQQAAGEEPEARSQKAEGSEQKQPATGHQRPATGLRATQATLRNGIRVIIAERHQTPLVAIRVLWPGGLRAEPPSAAGLSYLTAQLLLGGTRHHSAEAMASAVENRGGHLGVVSGKDAFGLSLDVLAGDTAFGLDLVRELATEAAFPAEELAREQARTLAQLRARQDDIFDVTSDRLRPLLLGEHPYARYPLGTPQTVAAITAGQCRTFFQRHRAPQQMVMAVVGDVRAADVLPLLERTVGTMLREEAEQMASPPLQFPAVPTQHTTRLAERSQAIVAFGFPGVAWTHPDRYAFDVVQAILSGSGGRLYARIRERAGVAYTLGAVHVPGAAGGYFFSYAATTPAQVEQVSRALQEEIASLVKAAPPPEELELAKRALRDAYFTELQDSGATASRLALDLLLGLGPEELEGYPEAIARVSQDDVARVLRNYLGSSSVVELRTLPTAE